MWLHTSQRSASLPGKCGALCSEIADINQTWFMKQITDPNNMRWCCVWISNICMIRLLVCAVTLTYILVQTITRCCPLVNVTRLSIFWGFVDRCEEEQNILIWDNLKRCIASITSEGRVIGFVLRFALGEHFRWKKRIGERQVSSRIVAVPKTYLNSTLVVFFLFVFKSSRSLQHVSRVCRKGI